MTETTIRWSYQTTPTGRVHWTSTPSGTVYDVRKINDGHHDHWYVRENGSPIGSRTTLASAKAFVEEEINA